MTQLRVLGSVSLAAFLSLASGCGGDDSGTLSYEDYEGVWTIESFTRAAPDCAAAPADVRAELMGDAHVLAATERFLGIPLLQLRSCGSVEACREEATRLGTIDEAAAFQGAYGTDGAGSPPELSVSTGGFEQDGSCEGARVRTSRVFLEGEVLRVESRAVDASGFPPDADGFCSAEDAQANAADAPCVELEVLSARRASPL